MKVCGKSVCNLNVTCYKYTFTTEFYAPHVMHRRDNNVTLNMARYNKTIYNEKGFFMRNRNIRGKSVLSSAFTLMELMIVIIILGLLASMVVPNILGKADEAKIGLVCPAMNTIANQLDTFKLHNGTYPTTEEGLEALVSNPSEEKYPSYPLTSYIKSKGQLKDTWKTPMIYVETEDGFDLISLGSDRKEGGKDAGKDIRFSECPGQK